MFSLPGLSYRDYEDLRVRSQSFAGLAATQLSGFRLCGGRKALGVPGTVIGVARTGSSGPSGSFVPRFSSPPWPSDLVWQETRNRRCSNTATHPFKAGSKPG